MYTDMTMNTMNTTTTNRRRKHGCIWSSILVYHLMGGKGERGVGRNLWRSNEGDYIDEGNKIELEERLQGCLKESARNIFGPEYPTL